MPKFIGPNFDINTGPGGDEGGEIHLAAPTTNTTLSGSVNIDVYQNKVRIFESGGSNRGAYIDLSAASGGVGSNLLGGGGATTLDGLSDVTAPSPSNGQFLKWDGTAWVNDTIDLATDTSGNYVSSLVAGTGVTITNNSGEGATPTIAIGQAVGATSDVTFNSVTAGGVEVGLFSSTISTTSGGITIAPASLTTTFGNNIDVNNGSVFTTSIDGSTSPWNSVTLYTDSGIVSVYGFLSANGDLTVNGKSTFNDPITVQGVRETVTASSISSNIMTCNYESGSIFYQATNPGANFTVNITNLPTDNGNAITVSIFVEQGSTGYIPNALQIAGTGQTIKWSGGTAPTPTSSSGKIDLFTFTLIRRNNAWTVLGSANLNY